MEARFFCETGALAGERLPRRGLRAVRPRREVNRVVGGVDRGQVFPILGKPHVGFLATEARGANHVAVGPSRQGACSTRESRSFRVRVRGKAA